ncbi:MAG: PfkB family carbohydrate kinase, partial [Candidatus Eremiobacterota bacterium]
AGAVVATSRVYAQLQHCAVRLDALVGSARDAGERYDPERSPFAEVCVQTKGSQGGSYRLQDGTVDRYPSVGLPGPVQDAYGCGDSFAAGLTFGLGSGLELPRALEVAARCGAWCLAGKGPYGNQLHAGN